MSKMKSEKRGYMGAPKKKTKADGERLECSCPSAEKIQGALPCQEKGAGGCDERVGERHCHGELTGLSQALRHADVVPEDGFTMSDDGTHCRVRAILRRKGREENPSKSTRPGAIQTSGSRAGPMA